MSSVLLEKIVQEQEDRLLVEEIAQWKRQHGNRVVILSHHYQRPELVLLGDHRGDSYELARVAAQSEAEHIVFCGVRFMAEAAAILARGDQKVHHPDPEAGCPMADMAQLDQVQTALDTLRVELGGEGEVLPVVYMNSPASVKGCCGEAGGIVCTSSNAARGFQWAWRRSRRILFLPDEHLGRNTATALGIPDHQVAIWDPMAGPLGGNSLDTLREAVLILWKGHCHVHTWFTMDHVAAARAAYPDGKLLVHPECTREVVSASDGFGSTGYLVSQVVDGGPGSTTVVGTETNLVRRLALEYPDRTVVPLARSLCPNMFRLTLEHVRNVLRNLDVREGVEVEERVKEGAMLALKRMLDLSPKAMG